MTKKVEKKEIVKKFENIKGEVFFYNGKSYPVVKGIAEVAFIEETEIDENTGGAK